MSCGGNRVGTLKNYTLKILSIVTELQLLSRDIETRLCLLLILNCTKNR